MKIEQVVFNVWHGIRRYGVVMSLYEKDEGIPVPWTYAKVRWFNDAAYKNSVEYTNKMRNDSSDIRLQEYRVDQLVQINLEEELKTLSSINSFIKDKEL